MCLLGAPVRYDGSGKECRTITRQMQERVDFVATCPEIGIGMGIPRPSVRIIASEQGDRLIESTSGKDHTDAMIAWSKAKADEIATENLHGFVLAKVLRVAGWSASRSTKMAGRVIVPGTASLRRRSRRVCHGCH